MAVQSYLKKKRMVLAFENGTTASGKPKAKQVSFSSINTECDVPAFHTIAKLLASLCSKNLLGIEMVDHNELSEQ